MAVLSTRPVARRSVLWALLALAVAGPVVFGLCMLINPIDRPGWLILLSLRVWFAATTLLFACSALWVSDEPRLVRIALIWGVLLFFVVTIAMIRTDGTIA
jgi:hypothetical protein